MGSAQACGKAVEIGHGLEVPDRFRQLGGGCRVAYVEGQLLIDRGDTNAVATLSLPTFSASADVDLHPSRCACGCNSWIDDAVADLGGERKDLRPAKVARFKCLDCQSSIDKECSCTPLEAELGFVRRPRSQ